MRRPFIRREQLARRAEIDEELVKDVFDVILACMEEGTAVQVDGFGTFQPTQLRPRVGRSPLVRGGEPWTTKGGLTMKLRVSPTLRRQWRGR